MEKQIKFKCKKCKKIYYFEKEIIEFFVKDGINFFDRDGKFFCLKCRKKGYGKYEIEKEDKTPQEKNKKRSFRQKKFFRRRKRLG
jgi:hypothetical protein